MNVRVGHGCHLSFLDLAYAPVRKHDEAVHMLLATQPIYGGRPFCNTPQRFANRIEWGGYVAVNIEYAPLAREFPWYLCEFAWMDGPIWRKSTIGRFFFVTIQQKKNVGTWRVRSEASEHIKLIPVPQKTKYTTLHIVIHTMAARLTDTATPLLIAGIRKNHWLQSANE